MQLFYYQRRDRQLNFGDELNSWLWRQAIPDLLDEDATTTFVGIGTLLNDLLPKRVATAKKVIVFSTGAGYENRLHPLPADWKIYAVRGPLTAQLLGLPKTLAITDGAVLLRRWYRPDTLQSPSQEKPEKRYDFGFMPHVHHANFADHLWQQACDSLGFCYIDPRWSVERVLGAISQTQVLVAEAMHGAIAADALRVPWIPVITSYRILPFKWQDWCASIQVPYRPQYLPPAAIYPVNVGGVRSGFKALFRSANYWRKCIRQYPIESLNAGFRRPQSLAVALQAVAKTASPMLSDATLQENLTTRLEEKLQELNRDFRA